MNVASEAGMAIEPDDCTIVEQFRTPNQTMNGGANIYWVFVYFYSDDNVYFCSRYIWSGNAGTRVGETNIIPSRRLICPCSTSK